MISGPSGQHFVVQKNSLQAISAHLARQYRENTEKLIQEVSQNLMSSIYRAEPWFALGYAQLRDKQRQHVHYMKMLMDFSQEQFAFEILSQTWPAFQSTEHQALIEGRYFQVQLQAWKTALARHIEGAQALVDLYDYLLQSFSEWHAKVLILSQQQLPDLNEVQEKFLQALLLGDLAQAQSIMHSWFKEDKNLLRFYQEVIQSCLYHVGKLQKNNQISVLEERIATMVVTRLMAQNQLYYSDESNLRGTALVTPAPAEKHDLGAAMVADLMTQAGWQVRFAGAGTPLWDMLEAFNSELPDVIVFSVTQSRHLAELFELIHKIRQLKNGQKLKILLGGQGLPQSIVEDWPVDACSSSIQAALQILSDWFPLKSENEIEGPVA